MRLLGAILKAKVLSGHPQHLRERPCIGPVPHERVGRTCLTDQGFSRRYEISYRGVKLPRVSAAFRRSYLRREAGLPHVGHQAVAQWAFN